MIQFNKVMIKGLYTTITFSLGECKFCFCIKYILMIIDQAFYRSRNLKKHYKFVRVMEMFTNSNI
jgi:hypothetical protein